jgi:hypothetical protein
MNTISQKIACQQRPSVTIGLNILLLRSKMYMKEGKFQKQKSSVNSIDQKSMSNFELLLKHIRRPIFTCHFVILLLPQSTP